MRKNVENGFFIMSNETDENSNKLKNYNWKKLKGGRQIFWIIFLLGCQKWYFGKLLNNGTRKKMVEARVCELKFCKVGKFASLPACVLFLIFKL